MKKVELTVTEKGHKAKNVWKKDDTIKVHPGIAKQLVEKGFAVEKGSKGEKK